MYEKVLVACDIHPYIVIVIQQNCRINMKMFFKKKFFVGNWILTSLHVGKV